MKKLLLSSFLAFGVGVAAQVNVTATGGTATASYTTLKAAFDAINAGTHQGDINLSVVNNTTETATAVLNASTTYTSVLIKPSGKYSISGSIASSPIVRITGSNVIIDGSSTVNGTTRDLTISNINATAPSVLYMGSAVSTAPLKDVVLKNTILSNAASTATNLILGNGAAAAGAGFFENVTIKNNEVKAGFNGIFCLGTATATNGNNLVISDNVVTSVVQNGVVVSGAGGTSTVSNNTINLVNPNAGTSAGASLSLGVNIGAGTNKVSIFGNAITIKHTTTATTAVNYASGIAINSGATNVYTNVYNNTISEISGILQYVNTSAIYLGSATANVNIYANRIFGLKNTNPAGAPMQGILLGSTSTAANTLVYNNVISDILGTSGSQVSGIYAFGGAGYKIYNNTVNLNTSNGETGVSAAFLSYSASGTGVTLANALDVRNNIFSNSRTTGSRYAILSSSPKTVFSNIDYNDYYSSGAALGAIGGLDNITLNDLKTGFGGNVNSLNLFPVFVSNTDMHLKSDSNEALDNKGIGLSEVTVDYDGVTRSATPDMGAYEFTYVAPTTVPTCAVISAPLNNAVNVAPNPTTISWGSVAGAAGYKVYIGKASGDYSVVNGTAQAGISYSAAFDINTKYFVKVVPYNTVGEATGCSEITFTTGDLIYCSAAATSPLYEKISRVQFANIDNSSTSTAGYEDFTSVIGTVERTKSYQMSVSISQFDADLTAVWIDYNQDGIFSSDEKVALSVTNPAIGNITIPANAKLGKTRMRVRTNYNTEGPACGDTTYGQVEDYTLDINVYQAVSDINKANVSVYPNPFKDVLKISDIKDAKSINVADASGRVVATPKVSEELNLSNLSKGVYFVTVSYENGSTKSFKVIKE